MSQHILLYDNKKILSIFNYDFLSMFNYNVMLKKIFLIKNVKCDISNFSESSQDYQSAGSILFSENKIFANFVT